MRQARLLYAGAQIALYFIHTGRLIADCNCCVCAKHGIPSNKRDGLSLPAGTIERHHTGAV